MGSGIRKQRIETEKRNKIKTKNKLKIKIVKCLKKLKHFQLKKQIKDYSTTVANAYLGRTRVILTVTSSPETVSGTKMT